MVEQYWDIKKYLRVIFQRKKIWIIVTILLGIVVILIALRLPDIYESSTLISVQQQPLLNPLTKKLEMGIPLKDRMATMRDEMLSFKFLYDVIQQLQLDEMMASPQQMDKLIDYLRKHLSITSKGEDTFKISFQGHNPQTVKQVVEKVINKYKTENQKKLETQYAGTIKFLEAQTKQYEKKLADSLDAVRAYKEKYILELPSEPNPNIAQLVELQSKLVTTQLELNSLIRDKEFLTQRLIHYKESPIIEEFPSDPELEALKAKLQEKEIELKQALSYLTEEHWTVKALQEHINAIKEQLASGVRELTTGEMATTNPLYLTLKKEIASKEGAIASLTANVKDIQGLIKVYEERLSTSPKREQELASLERQKAENEQMYRLFRDKLESAKVSSQIESAGQGVIFEILDPPRIPESPIGPGRKKIALLGLLIALGIGLGLAFLIEFLNHSFHTMEEIQSSLDIPILGTMQKFFTHVEIKQMKRRKRRTVVLASIVVIVLAATLAIVITQYPNFFEIFKPPELLI